MPRTTNPQAVAKKQDEILTAFQRLIYTKGYEDVSIQDILDAAKISKGALYHYFESKQAMLEMIMETMLEAGEVIIAPIAQQEAMAATDKLSRVFIDAGKWKVDHGKEVFAVFSAWYAPGNDMLRYRMRSAGIQRYQPYFESIIAEGIQQGVFTVTDASITATILFTVVTDLSDTLSRLILNRSIATDVKVQEIERLIQEYTSAVERMLGAPAGSMALIDEPALRYWIAFTQELYA